jgi:hypothetical protein
MYYFIQRGDQLQVEVDCHITRLFPVQLWREHLAAFGFRVQDWPSSRPFTAGGCPLLIGTLE